MRKISSIQLGKKTIGPGEPVFIIAEVANCHNGSFETAQEMVRVISETGVDAVKFQHHIPSEEMTSDHPKFRTQEERSLSIGQLASLKKEAEARGLYFLCTPFSRKATDELEEIGCNAFKIGSGEATDLPFIDYVARKGKPMLVSTGMSSLEEVGETADLIKSHRTPFMLFHAVSIYPPSYKHLNLGVIPTLRERFGVLVGLSDHTPEIYSAIASVPYGVACIEKHYTLGRNQAGTSDHKVSLEPHELKTLVDAVRKIELACGSNKRIFEEEKSVIAWARHSVVSIKEIPKGTVVTADMVTTKRPLFDGIPAKKLERIIGRRTRITVSKDSRIRWEDIIW